MYEPISCSYENCLNNPDVFCKCSQIPIYLCKSHSQPHISSKPSTQHKIIKISYPLAISQNKQIKSTQHLIKTIQKQLKQNLSRLKQFQNQLTDINALFEEQIQSIMEELGPIQKELQLALVKNYFSMFTRSQFVHQLVKNPSTFIQQILEKTLYPKTSAIGILNQISNISPQDRKKIKNTNLSQDKTTLYRIVSCLTLQDMDSLLKVVLASRQDCTGKWAPSNSVTILNFANYSFNDLDLSGIKIRGANLSNAQLQKTNLRRSDLRETNLTDCNLTNTCLRESNLLGASISISNEAHHSQIIRLRYSQDGKYLITGGGDGLLNLWNMQNEELQHTFRGHTASIMAVDICIEKGLIASGSFDKSAKLWTIDQKQEIHIFTEHHFQVTSVRFSPSEQYLAVGDYKGNLFVHRIDSGQCQKYIQAHFSSSIILIYLLSDNQIASAGQDGYLKVWNLDTKPPILQIKLNFSILTLKYSFQRNQIACGMWNGELVLVCLESHSIKKKWSASKLCILDLDYTPCGNSLISLSKQNIQIWELASQFCSSSWENQQSRIVCMTISPNGTDIALGMITGEIRIMKINTGQISLKFSQNKKKIKSFCVSNCGEFLATFQLNSQIIIWDSNTSQKLAIIKYQTICEQNLCFNYDSCLIASSCPQGIVKVCQWKISSLIHTFSYQSGQIFDIQFSPKENKIACCGEGNLIRVWNLNSKREECQLKLHSDIVRSISFHPEGVILASSSDDKTVKIWDLDLQQLILNLQGNKSTMQRLKFSADSRFLGSCSQDKGIVFWRVEEEFSFSEIHTFFSKTSDICFSQCGNFLLFPRRNELIVLNIEEGSEKKCVKLLNQNIIGILAPQRGKFVYSCDDSRIIKWNVFEDVQNNIEYGLETEVWVNQENDRIYQKLSQDETKVYSISQQEQVFQDFQQSGICLYGSIKNYEEVEKKYGGQSFSATNVDFKGAVMDLATYKTLLKFSLFQITDIVV